MNILQAARDSAAAQAAKAAAAYHRLIGKLATDPDSITTDAALKAITAAGVTPEQAEADVARFKQRNQWRALGSKYQSLREALTQAGADSRAAEQRYEAIQREAALSLQQAREREAAIHTQIDRAEAAVNSLIGTCTDPAILATEADNEKRWRELSGERQQIEAANNSYDLRESRRELESMESRLSGNVLILQRTFERYRGWHRGS